MNNSQKQRMLRFRSILKTFIPLIKDSLYWFMHDLKYSSSTNYNERSDLAKLMINSHVLEKGLTMPGRRLGFGYEKIRAIITQCNRCIEKYGEESIEVQSTLKDLEQYLGMHKSAKYELAKDIEQGIEKLLYYKRIDTKECYTTSRDVFFAPTKDFSEFAQKRHTLRWFSDEPIADDIIKKAVELAMTAPSACNRQSIKVYVIESEEKKKQVLGLQTGNRGFGELADKIICVTADSRYYAYSHRPMANVDGGIFTMNLLYALHYYNIAACTLNACLNTRNRKVIVETIGMDKAEFPIVFIVIGKAPESFMVAASQRVKLENRIQFV